MRRVRPEEDVVSQPVPDSFPASRGVARSAYPELTCVMTTAGTFLHVSPLWESTFRYVGTALVGRSFYDLVHPDERDAASAVVCPPDTGNASDPCRLRCRRGDGEYRWVEWTAHSMGDQTYAVGRDVTDQTRAEGEVDRLSRMLESVVAQSTVPMVVVSMPDHIIRFRNAAAADMLGVAFDSPSVGRSVLSLDEWKTWTECYPDGRPIPTHDLPLARALRGAVVTNAEVRIRRSDGTERWEMVNAAPVYDRDGELIAGLLTFLDITELRQQDEALKLANRQLRMIGACNHALIRAADEPELLRTVCEIAVQTGGYRMAWVGFVEYDADRTVRPVTSAGHTDGYLANGWSWGDNPRGRGIVGEAVRSGFPNAVQHIEHDDRVLPWREAAVSRGYRSACALPLASAGTVFGVLAVYSSEPESFDAAEVELLSELSEDLAFGIGVLRTRIEHQRALENLSASDARVRGMLQHSHDVIALVSADHRVVSLFGPSERVVGYRADDLVGIATTDIVHPDDVAERGTVTAATTRDPQVAHRTEYRIRHKDGRWIPVEVVGTSIELEDGQPGAVLNIRDMSERDAAERERRRLQEQLQQAMKMEAVGRLAGGVAHDFNNMLTAITGNVELLRMDLEPGDPLLASVEAISKAAESATGLTRQLLAFSRQQVIEPRVVSLNDLVERMHRMTTRLIGEDVVVQMALTRDLGSVRVDPGQFEQVILNLVVNARDAMPHGGKLCIETADVNLDDDYCRQHPYVSPGPHVMLAVSDTGHGMTPEVKRRIFEPFFTTKPEGKGTGLGLATTFGIVKQAGGTIEVYSEVGHGTTFKIYVPRVAEPPQKLARGERHGDLPRGHETVLLVEDDGRVREVALAMLKRLGYQVLSAANGGEALMYGESHDKPIDLLLTDVVMPGMNGRELAERFARLHPESKVIFTSGYTGNDVIRHGVLDGEMQFIGKPYSLAALAHKLRDVMDGRAGRT